MVVAGWCDGHDGVVALDWRAAGDAGGHGSAALFNGFIIVKSKLNSFIVTLASLFIFTGLVQGISQGFPYSQHSQGLHVHGP